MKNYEHFFAKENAKQFLHDILVDQCKYCAHVSTQGCADDRCGNGIVFWLMRQYEEPDSWDKLLDDLDSGKVLYTYSNSFKTTQDIATRIRKLREAKA